MTSENDYDHLELQQSYSHWDASADELDNDNSSARLFERSRIKALAGVGLAVGHRGPRRYGLEAVSLWLPLLQMSGRRCRRRPSPSG